MMKQKRYLKMMTMILLMMMMMMTLMVSSTVRSESLMGGHLDNQAISNSDNGESTLRYRIANVVPFAFNGGQPFSLEKDPVTGQIDFDKAPPLKALNYTGSYEDNDDDTDEYDIDRQQQITNKESENDTENNNNSDKNTIELLSKLNDDEQQIPNEINPYSPSFHDFLNLPVRYSDHEKYTNDKYPLISNSYANTKVQGGSNTYNANAINHKNYHHYGGKASTSQSYSMTRRPFVPRITTTRRPITTASTKKPTTTTTQPSTTTTTTKRPTTTTTATTTTTTTSTTTTTTTTPKSTTTVSPPQSTTSRKSITVDRYDDDYMEGMLPIEKIQNTDGNNDQMDQIFGTSDNNAYDDNYEDYAPIEFQQSASPSPSISTSTTTIKATTTSTTPSPPSPITSMPLDPMPINSENNIGIHRPGQGAMNVGFNDYLNHPINHPSYSGLVVESASNVIVPPDQDTISFVLGNRQNVQGSYYAQGSAIPESPYGDMAAVRPLDNPHHNLDLPTNPHHNLHHQYHHHHHHHNNQPLINEVPPMEQNSGQKWWFNNDQSEKSQSVVEKTKDDKINVVAGYRVVFPTSAPETSTSIEDISSTLPATTILPSSPPIVSTLNDGLSELSEILTPPAIDGAAARPSSSSSSSAQRPSSHYPSHHHYHQPRPEIPTRIQRPPLVPNNGGYKIRPPHIDINLPNILPQFRPNVKTSQRRGSDAIGTMIVSGSSKYPPRVSMRPPPPPQPSSQPQHRPPSRRPIVSHLQRLNPPPPPPPPVHALRLPAPSALIGTPDIRNPSENVPLQNEIPPLRRNVIGIEGQLDERKRLPSASNQILKSRLNDEDAEKIAADSLAMPPRAPLFPKRKIGNSSVATLQMIQQHRVQSDIVNNDKVIIGDNDDGNASHEQNNRRVDESPVYVVYPVKGSMDIRPESHDSDDEKEPMDESVVIGIHGPQRPLPPENLSQQSNENENDKIVPVRAPVHKTSKFPYPPAIQNPSLFISQLQEKPLLVPNEHQNPTEDESFDDKNLSIINQQDRDTSINIIPYLQDHQPFPIKSNVISTTLQLFGSQSSSSSLSASSVTPIAYVYTPTTRAPLRRPIESFERKPVLLPSQQPSSSSSSAPSPQNFMAPFVASISAEAPSKNGWSVVTGGPFVSKSSESNDKIDRNDDNNNDNDENNTKIKFDIMERNKNASKDENNNRDKVENNESSGTQSSNGHVENFDADNFKPQLFGGFQPIFEFPSDNDETTSVVQQRDTVTMMDKPRLAKDSGS